MALPQTHRPRHWVIFLICWKSPGFAVSERMTFFFVRKNPAPGLTYTDQHRYED